MAVGLRRIRNSEYGIQKIRKLTTLGFGILNPEFLLMICSLIAIILLTGFPQPLQAEDSGSRLVMARLKYGGGGDWYNDAEILVNLQKAWGEQFRTAVFPREVVVSLRDATLFDYPLLFLTGHGNIRFDEGDRRVLREYLEAGGFLYADDDYGMDESFRREMSLLFPDHPLTEIPVDHPIHQVPNPVGLLKMHEHEEGPPRAFGIFIEGRMVVYYTWNSNVSDGWADARTHGDPDELRRKALSAGVNIIYHALTH